MANMLIRDIPDETKQRLAERAKLNGRSQNAEALSILEEALQPVQKNWLQILRECVEECGGVEELELPPRHPAREFSFEEA